MKISKRIALPLGTLAAAVAFSSHAEPTAGTFFINPAVNYTVFGGERDLDPEVGGQIGLEYLITDNIGVELSYAQSKPEIDFDVSPLDGDVKYKRWNLDALYYLGTFGKFAPYLAAGVGEGTFDFDQAGVGNHTETQVNFGGGVRYFFTENFSARADIRGVNSLDEEETDGVVSLGLSYSFGGTPKAAAAAPEAPSDYCTKDDDNDGVCNEKDQCPNTDAKFKVDENGCPRVLKQAESMNLNVTFKFDSSVVQPQFSGRISEAAEFLKKYPEITAEIEGHTDSKGTDEYNQRLSEQRANAVREVLVQQYGIDASRLRAVGYGEARPVSTNDTDAGRAENRRVMATFEAEVEQAVTK